MDRVGDAKRIATKNIRRLACGTLSFSVVRGIIVHLSAFAYSHLKSCHSSDLSCKTDIDWDIQAIVLLCVVIEVATAWLLRLACNPKLIASDTKKALLFSCIWFVQRTLFLPLELYFTFAMIFKPFYQSPSSSRMAISLTLMLMLSVIVRVAFQIIFGFFIYHLYHFHRHPSQHRMKDENEHDMDKQSGEGAGDYNNSLAGDSNNLSLK